MEIARMNYYFTGTLIILLTLLAFCVTPAYPRNEYLNDGSSRCGEVDVSVSNRDYEYDNYDRSWNESNSQELRLTFRKYLGTDCKTSKENAQLKQQLELMKMCNKVNRNPSLAQNKNFALLVSKCRGVVPQVDEIETMPTGSLWDELKDDYIKENPDSKTLDNNNSTLKIPPEGYILPKPKPKDD
jgi:hypothetical protein|tara:strand:+ start:147 stop:701 length:555 start_codon:yes stop_codon:yes gene_type:complete